MRLGRTVVAEANGRIRLSWAQIAWAIAMIVAVLATWGDLRVSLARVETKMDNQESRISALEARNANAGFTRDDAAKMKDDILSEVGGRPAHAATRNRPRR